MEIQSDKNNGLEEIPEEDEDLVTNEGIGIILRLMWAKREKCLKNRSEWKRRG
jgi:hypothetical protein